MTIREATQSWVREFNAVPMGVLEKLMAADPDAVIEITPEAEDNEERYDALPIWGTLWSFGDSIDSDWLEDHLREMADCGFRIYRQEDYGYLFGIDGAGYDFYEAHWIPLYRARGLRWHE